MYFNNFCYNVDFNNRTPFVYVCFTNKMYPFFQLSSHTVVHLVHNVHPPLSLSLNRALENTCHQVCDVVYSGKIYTVLTHSLP